MDLWVVNDMSRRSRMRNVPGPSAVRGARIRGRFGLSGECWPKEAVGSGSGTGWEGVAGWDQAIGNRSNDRAGDRGGVRVGKPRWARIFAMTGGCSMAAMIIKGPLHCGHCSMSISNTRLSNRAQLMRARGDGGGASPWSAEETFALAGALGMISARSVALGASTPWKRTPQASEQQGGCRPIQGWML